MKTLRVIALCGFIAAKLSAPAQLLAGGPTAATVPSGTETFAFASGSSPEPVNLPAFRRALQLPLYLQEFGLSGEVMLRVLVDTTGRPVQVEVLRCTNPHLEHHVLAHVNKLRFTPAMQNGEAVAAWVRVPVHFAQN